MEVDSVSWCQPMSGTVGNVIYLVSTQEEISKMRYRQSNEKHTVTCCCSLRTYSVCGIHLLNLYAFLVRCRLSLTVLSETWNGSVSSRQVWPFSSTIAAFRASSFRTYTTITMFSAHGEISRPALLEPMNGGAHTHTIILKVLTYMRLWTRPP